MAFNFSGLLDALRSHPLDGSGDVRHTYAHLDTDNISLVSHAHGRLRREERAINTLELQAAVKHGRKERANPGRDGSQRWRYTHKGVVYITDLTSRHEITSWRLDAVEEDSSPAVEIDDNLSVSSHTVLVVDHSGSMRKPDVPGYTSRTAAVYDCLVREFVEPQMKVVGAGDAVVSLIEMSDGARLVINRHPIDDNLIDLLKLLGDGYAKSHGNYLPALDKVLELFRIDNARKLFLLFLSDGAPSDHNFLECAHGVQVWQPDLLNAKMHRSGRPSLRACGNDSNSKCRQAVKERVQKDCLERLTKLGDMLGRDRVYVGTIAFGPPGDDYQVLQAMAKRLPQGSFQKLGLSVDSLKTAFSSLTSDLTTMRTEMGGTTPLTLRKNRFQETSYHRNLREESLMDDLIDQTSGWDIYRKDEIKKHKYDMQQRRLVEVPLTRGAEGVAVFHYWFSQGVERLVYKCTEIKDYEERGGLKFSSKFGEHLVAKESKHEDFLTTKFQETFCKTQGEAERLALMFNRRIAGHPLARALSIHFLPCVVYEIKERNYPGGIAWMLAEPELEGVFTKWNNNAGHVRRTPPPPPTRHPPALGRGSLGLGMINEDDEDDEDDEDEDYNDQGRADTARSEEDLYETSPQAFSHFTYDATHGKELVCDLQGVWNATDGFTMTDPVIHHVSRTGRRHTNGATDKGADGILNFFKTHRCNQLCQFLGLQAKGEGC